MCRATECSDVPNYDLSLELGLVQCDYLNAEETGRITPGRNDISVIQMNVRGLLNKQDQIKELLRTSRSDIVLMCETWLNSSTEKLVDIPGYKLINKNRIDRIGGGVCILIKQDLRSRKRDDLCVETQLLEHHVVEVKTDTKNILFVAGYRPPNSNVKTLLKEYNNLLVSLRKCRHHELVIGIDHNLDLLKTHSHSQTSEFLELNLTNDLTPCITKPTHVTHKSATLIDNIFISPKLHQDTTPFILNEDISDHLPTVALLSNQKKCIKECKTITTRDLNEANINKIKEDLNGNDWDTILMNQNCNEGFNIFHRTVCESIDKHAPEMTRTISYKNQVRDPWITKGILTSLTKQKRLYREQLHAKTAVSTYKYRTYRNFLKGLIRKSKHAYLHSKCVEFKQDSRKLWQLVNKIIGKSQNKTDSIDNLRIDNVLRYDPNSITNGFCEFFSHIGEKYAKLLDSNESEIDGYIKRIDSNKASLYLAPTSVVEVKELIQKLPLKTSSGHDNISNTLLKKLNESITIPLTVIFNKSLEEGKFPDQMKLADIFPLFKSKDRSECTNYRPISLLMTLSKLLEKLVYKRTYTFLEKHNKLYESQYGFRDGHSCENAISELISEATKGQQEGMYTLALFLDLSKAFDSLEHSVLLRKMERYGLRGKCNDWFASYLQDRRMRVKCTISSTGKQEYSQYQSVNYGTPQGSCLGPLIFIIFTNDLNRQLMNSCSLLFADDTTLYMTHRNLRYLKWCIEEDMRRLITWFKSNKLTLNLGKTECLLFQKNGQRQTITIELDNIKVSNSKEVKFLGMWLDEYLNWQSHVRKLTLKLTRNQNLLKYSSKMMPVDTKKLVYHAHIGSHLQYGILLWGNGSSKEQIRKLQKIQNKCLSYVTGNKINSTSMNKELKILTINDLIQLANQKFGYKLLHDMLPKKVSEACMMDSKKKNLMPKHTYNTRARRIPNLPKNMNKRYKASFLACGPRSILTLSVETRLAKNLESFTRKCKQELITTY